jgi:hypothetical protein
VIPCPAFTALTDRFAAAIRGLRDSVSARLNETRVPAPLRTLIRARLSALILRFTAIVARAQQPPANPRPPRIRDRTQDPTRAAPPGDSLPRDSLPRDHAWLLRMVPATTNSVNAAAYGRAEIQTLLADPAMRALIAATPAAGRLLRPLCHMLGLPVPPELRLPKRPRRPRVTTAPHPPRQPRRQHPPRPSPYPVPPRPPSAYDMKFAYLQMFGGPDYNPSPDFSPPDFST